MSHLIDVLIPTFNNPQYLFPCIESLLMNQTTAGLIKITVVNNGDPGTVQALPKHVDVIQLKENRNWCGGLQAGLDATSAPFVLFCNDDIHVPASSRLWPNMFLQHLVIPEVAAIGPSSNFVMGSQAIWQNSGPSVFRVPFLIGFFMLLRRSHLMEAGGIDETFTCGDDMDLSIRFRKIGKTLLADKNVFVFHHGAKTGPRTEGSYWYSAAQQEKTWTMLFQKHGVKTVHDMLMRRFEGNDEAASFYPTDDVEGDLVRSFVLPGKVVELGCGGNKTVPDSVGIDLIPKGQIIPNLREVTLSQSDVVADVSQKLPLEKGTADVLIARHILEHCLDPVEAIRNWAQTLKPGGRLIVALPDQAMHGTIPMNAEHVHAFTQDSLRNLFNLLGFKEIVVKPAGNNISIVGVFEVNGTH